MRTCGLRAVEGIRGPRGWFGAGVGGATWPEAQTVTPDSISVPHPIPPPCIPGSFLGLTGQWSGLKPSSFVQFGLHEGSRLVVSGLLASEHSLCLSTCDPLETKESQPSKLASSGHRQTGGGLEPRRPHPGQPQRPPDTWPESRGGAHTSSVYTAAPPRKC